MTIAIEIIAWAGIGIFTLVRLARQSTWQSCVITPVTHECSEAI